MANIIDGKKISEKILTDIKKEVSNLDKVPGLAALMIGDNPASHLYIKTKQKTAQKVGITFSSYFCNGEKCQIGTKESEIVESIEWLNNDTEINGIILQLPLPKNFDTEKLIKKISPQKDVDGFHPDNIEKIKNGNPEIIPPLIGAIHESLKYTQQNLEGKTAIVVGKNSVFTQPLTASLNKFGLKSEIVEPSNKSLAKKTKTADVLIVIVGQKHLIKKSMVKKDVIIIDIGTNLTNQKDNKWIGDVDPKVAEVASWITPVPGGIGPLTVALLLKNTLEIAKKNQ